MIERYQTDYYDWSSWKLQTAVDSVRLAIVNRVIIIWEYVHELLRTPYR